MKKNQTKNNFIENNNTNSFIENNIIFDASKNISQKNIYERCLSDLEDIKNETNTSNIISKIKRSNEFISTFLTNKKQIKKIKITNKLPIKTKYLYRKKIIPNSSTSFLKPGKKNSNNNLLYSKNISTTENSNKTNETTLYNILQEKIQNIKDSQSFYCHNFSFHYNSNLNNTTTSIDTNHSNNINSNNKSDTLRYLSKKDFSFDNKKNLYNLKKTVGRNSYISSYNNLKKCFDKNKKPENKRKKVNNCLYRHNTFKKIPLCPLLNEKNKKKFSFIKRTKTSRSSNDSNFYSRKYSTKMIEQKNYKNSIKKSLSNKNINCKNKKKDKKPLCVEIDLEVPKNNDIKENKENNGKEKLIKKMCDKNVNIKKFKNDFIIIPKINDENI